MIALVPYGGGLERALQVVLQRGACHEQLIRDRKVNKSVEEHRLSRGEKTRLQIPHSDATRKMNVRVFEPVGFIDNAIVPLVVLYELHISHKQLGSRDENIEIHTSSDFASYCLTFFLVSDVTQSLDRRCIVGKLFYPVIHHTERSHDHCRFACCKLPVQRLERVKKRKNHKTEVMLREKIQKGPLLYFSATR